MKTMHLKIYKAADAFLYLPTYIAEEYGIFDTLLKDYVNKVDFYTAENGDCEAIDLMLQENNNSHDSLAIAIADPTAFLSKRNDYEFSEVRVIGALIDKLPFWAVDHIDKLVPIDKFNKEFEEVIHYNDNYKTGYYLGNRIKNQTKIWKSNKVAFGEEIQLLCKEIEPSTTNKKCVAITADIVSLARAKSNSKIYINYRFSDEGRYITTGIITSNKCIDQNSNILSKIIEGIQKSISMLYSSDKIAKEICTKVSKKEVFNSVELNEKEIEEIVQLVNKERFYPADLNVSKDCWNLALKALVKTEQWEDNEQKSLLENSFDIYIDNRFVLTSEKNIANQYGIDLTTFDEEVAAIIEPIKVEKDRLRLELSKIGKRTYKFGVLLTNLFRYFSKHFFKILFAISVLVVLLVCLYFGYYYYVNKKLADFSGSVITSLIASGIVFLLTLVRNKKNEIK